MKNLQGNIWKYFVYNLSQRRNLMPIVAIYFLTLPNATAKMIGFYTALGSVASFFLEIPSGYLADRWGHKKTIILSKIIMIASTLCFIIGKTPWVFMLGAILFPVSFAFWSGTADAFMHNTLTALKKENDYTKIMSKVGANVSIVSLFIILLLPYMTKFNLLAPFYITLLIDIVGFFVVLTLVNPPEKYEVIETHKSIYEIAKQVKGTGFYTIALYLGIITGFFIGLTNFREVYLQYLGFPVIWIGAVMASSRAIWFIFGHNAHIIEEKFKLKNILFFEAFFFSILFILASYLSNPYSTAVVLAIMPGYLWGRSQMMNKMVLNKFVPDKRYKATMLSIAEQVKLIITIIFAFGIGFVMQQSYKLGHFVGGVSMFILLMMLYPFVYKILKSD